MNYLKRLRLQIKETQRRTYERKMKQRYGEKGTAKQCIHCSHFVYRVERPRNWVCRCPDDKLRFRGTLCFGFEPGEHPDMVMFNSG